MGGRRVITYEIKLYDSAFGCSYIGVHTFMCACRIYNSISLDPELIYQKELISHDWVNGMKYRVSLENV